MSSDLARWLVLAAVVGSMLALDLRLVDRRARPVSFREAATWSAIWISLAAAFGAFVAATKGGQAGGEFVAGYLIELSLSVDNVFVFALIFSAFVVPAAYQHRLLFWGILGAIVFRGLFIAAGTAILATAHWVIYLLGALLIITGIRLARSRGHVVRLERNPILRLFRRFVPTTDGYRGPAFVVRDHGRLLATPLLVALVAVETTDVMFALDSIPAVFAVTTDPLIVFSSNLFAILGLRSLYFLLAGLLDRLAYLKAALAALLVFAGAKILVAPIYEVPIAASLGVIVAILAFATAASLWPSVARWTSLRAPLARICAGVVMGLAAVACVVIAVSVRDGATWLGPLVAAVLVTGSGVVVAAVIRGSGHALGPGARAAVLHIGSGVLLGSSMLLVLAGAAILPDTEVAAPLATAIALGAACAVLTVMIMIVGRRRASSVLIWSWLTTVAVVGLALAAFVAEG